MPPPSPLSWLLQPPLAPSLNPVSCVTSSSGANDCLACGLGILDIGSHNPDCESLFNEQVCGERFFFKAQTPETGSQSNFKEPHNPGQRPINQHTRTERVSEFECCICASSAGAAIPPEKRAGSVFAGLFDRQRFTKKHYICNADKTALRRSIRNEYLPPISRDPASGLIREQDFLSWVEKAKIKYGFN